jgi:CubicO group peptidase (beta-lactamase class C family)
MNTKTFPQKLQFALLVLFTGVVSTIWQPVHAAPLPGSERPGYSMSDQDNIESYWDDFFAREMETFGVHGAVMIMVKEGEISFIKGYGYADASEGTPFDPETTILRSGSIAKTLTATAIMQLAEDGKLDLDADVNTYLSRFKVPDTFPEPVTTRHLINMTGGFDTRMVGIRAENANEIQPLGDYLAERMPARVLPPGRYRRYNDHELALAGYIIEEVTGISYEAYVRQHIFEPLDMVNSTILLPNDQIIHAARGYPVGGGPEDAYPLSYYYLHNAPGTGFNSTASDIANFLIAHLEKGKYVHNNGSSRSILQPETMDAMHQTAFTYHPKMLGQANTFDEMSYNGQRYLRKSGGAPGMHNNLLLFEEQGLGFYLFYNSDGTGLRNEWTEEILNMVLPEPKVIPVIHKATPDSTNDLSSYAGEYLKISDETSVRTIVQIQALVNPDLWVRVNDNLDGSVNINGQRYIEIESGLFQNPTSGRYSAFEIDRKGQATYLFQERTPYERVSWIEYPSVQLSLLGLAVLVFIWGLAVTVVSLVRGKLSGRMLSGAISILNIVFLVALGLLLLPVATGGDVWQFSLEPSLELRLVLLIPLITSILATILFAGIAINWRKVQHSTFTRFYNISVLIGAGLYINFLHTWNILGWRF